MRDHSLVGADIRVGDNKRYLTGHFDALPDVNFSQVIGALDITRSLRTTG
ncbi:hypothetical protein CHIBA101_1790 [Actinomyces sp. Chiba101]|uniref:Uncharacterized protein n=1 Tax=Actinomyces denticolens TaxID=52767 RepID=A0ABY1HYX1_9ACTO|nr:hypothetical protein CHIBA101_1790 [Actinomyces sp. Chiba101]GAV93527.1 hypothetical protein ADENT20671_0273 [Actinomyces denticolens]SHI33114.1 hypothetical protein SAMN05216246_101257 [Actinomyces denticolens]SUU74581.1 Uncharacterised protein [Actinomyces denticolens]